MGYEWNLHADKEVDVIVQLLINKGITPEDYAKMYYGNLFYKNYICWHSKYTDGESAEEKGANHEHF